MSRADNRKKQREQSKNDKWLKSLTSSQLQIVKSEITNEVIVQVANYIEYAEIVTSNILLDYENYEATENKMLQFEKDMSEGLRWIKNKGERWLDYLKESDLKAKNLIKKMLQEGAKQKDIVEAIKKEFGVTTSIANRSFKVAREEWLKEKEEAKEYDPEVEDGAKYIFEEPGSGEEEERALMERVELAEPGPEVVLDIEDKPVVATTKALDSGFEVISRAETVKMELKGKYADYKYENSNGDIVVNVDTEEETLTFLSITDVDKYEFEEIEKFKARMREVKEVFRL